MVSRYEREPQALADEQVENDSWRENEQSSTDSVCLLRMRCDNADESRLREAGAERLRNRD